MSEVPLNPPGAEAHGQPLPCSRKVDARLPGKGNSNSHDARPVHLIITMMRWILTSRLKINNSTPEWSMTHFDMFLKVNSPSFLGKLTSKVNSRSESEQ